MKTEKEVLKILKFYTKLLIIFLAISLGVNALTYKVKTGDNLAKIAKKYHVSVEDIIRTNNLKKPYIIRPGQKLIIPEKSKRKASTTYCAIKHKVKRGESLIKIAKKYHVWVKDLKKLNNLKDNTLYAGQVLCIKKAVKKLNKKYNVKTQSKKDMYIKKEKVITKRIIYYRVKRGDSLSKIAKKFGTTVSRIIKLNRLKKPYIIYPGQKLKVEKKEVSYIEKIVKRRTVPFGFIWPLKGKVTEKFINNTQKRHLGIDIQSECNIPIKAAESGKVIYAGDSIKSYGNLVIIKHANRFNTVYGHIGKIKVKEGQIVSKGDIIGYTGKLNNSNKCGVYFEIRKNAIPVDPLVFLSQKNGTN